MFEFTSLQNSGTRWPGFLLTLSYNLVMVDLSDLFLTVGCLWGDFAGRSRVADGPRLSNCSIVAKFYITVLEKCYRIWPGR